MTLTNPAQIAPDTRKLSRAIPAELRPLVAAVDEYRKAAKAPATLRGYSADWRCFTAWCERNHLEPLPAAAETVALYIADLAGVKAASTIRRRLTTISQAHKKAGLETPTRLSLVSETWTGICNRFGVATSSKAPVRTEVLRRMLETLDLGRLIGVRDRALLVIGFAGALRRSELVALDVREVTEVPDGLELFIRRSKTDQKGAGVKVGLPYGSDSLTCPIRAYRAWLEVSGIANGPVFRPVTKGGALGLQRLSPAAVAQVVKRTAERAGFEPASLGGHSLRSGLITSAAENGVLERDIMRQSRHKSVAVMRGYIEDATLFQDNAAAKVGL